MTKRLNAKIGTYEKDGQTKGRYVSLGVILSNNNGEYLLLDPTVNLAGVLSLQNQMAVNEGKQTRDRVMVSVFSDDNQRQQSQQSSGYGSGGNANAGANMDDEIPFAPERRI